MFPSSVENLMSATITALIQKPVASLRKIQASASPSHRYGSLVGAAIMMIALVDNQPTKQPTNNQPASQL